jgi:methylated-DNA-[protein]-cysteine S-methyltransferase
MGRIRYRWRAAPRGARDRNPAPGAAPVSIPRGETATFAELARKLGASGAAHAVGQAIDRNPLPILVPCHRVLTADGATEGFGINSSVISKRRLLSLEGALAKGGPTLFDALLAPPRPQS